MPEEEQGRNGEEGVQGNFGDDLNDYCLDCGNSLIYIHVTNFVIPYILSMCTLLHFDYTSIIFLVDYTPPDSKTMRRLKNQTIFVDGAKFLPASVRPRSFLPSGREL